MIAIKNATIIESDKIHFTILLNGNAINNSPVSKYCKFADVYQKFEKHLRIKISSSTRDRED